MTDSKKIQTIAALGRPFHLGSLYDFKSDQLISGVTLWNKADLDKDTLKQVQRTSDVHFITSDTMRGKSSAMNLSANVKLNILSGLVEVSGAAQYLKNKKKSTCQERVTLIYKCTTRAEELSMEHLGPGCITHPQVFDQGIATHVVTGIVYGANAVFIFDRTHDSSENKKDSKFSLEGAVKKLPKIAGCAGFNYNGERESGEIDENINCRFFGDIYLNENPSTFQEAIKTYKELPNTLGKNEENAVPVEVRLFPLMLLDSKASRLVRDISGFLISDTETSLETLLDLRIRCNDLKESDNVRKFPGIEKEIKTFLDLMEIFEYDLKHKLSLLLPGIRGGGEEESSLAELLRRNKLSPCSDFSLLAWVDKTEKHLDIVNGYIGYLNCIELASKQSDLISVVSSLEVKQCLCLVIYVPRSCSQLEMMRNYLKAEDTSNENQRSKNDSCMTPVKCNNGRDIRATIRSFKLFTDNNKNKTGTKFLVMVEGGDSEKISATVKYYQDGGCESEDYELPSAPGGVSVAEDDTSHDRVTVQWSPPENGTATTQKYCVTYKEVMSSQGARTVWSDTCHATLCDLVPNTMYEVSVQAWCKLGYGPHSDVFSDVCTEPVTTNSDQTTWYREGQGVKIQRHSTFTVPDTHQTLKQRARNDLSKHHTTVGNLEIRILDMRVEHRHVLKKVQNLTIGQKTQKTTKIILLVGGTCTGKTTLINAMVNYIYRVDYTDDFRLIITDDNNPHKLSKVESHTNWITAYNFYHLPGMPFDNGYILIDTPGFGDKRGIQRNQILMKQLYDFLTQNYGIDQVDGIGFVIDASAARLTLTQCYFYYNILLSMFGKDMKDNIFIMATFSDAKPPKAIEVSQKIAGFPCAKHFKFNNSALFSSNRESVKSDTDDDADNLDIFKLYWDMSYKSLTSFFTELGSTSPASLALTRKVLEERDWLYTLVSPLCIQIDVGLQNNNRNIFILLHNKISKIRRSVERLKEIALKPNSRSTSEYIELMMGFEKVQRRDKFQERIKMLLFLRKEEALIQEVYNGRFISDSLEDLLTQFSNLIR